jgi:hypothetical protein
MSEYVKRLHQVKLKQGWVSRAYFDKPRTRFFQNSATTKDARMPCCHNLNLLCPRLRAEMTISVAMTWTTDDQGQSSSLLTNIA